jgi:uncharacterized membrane protein HdeD (DUF308 family)
MSMTWLTRLLALRGVLAVIFGILALVWPRATVLALALLFGAYALLNGIGLLAAGIRPGRDRWQRVAQIVGGILGIVAAIVTVLWPGVTAFVLVVLIGAWALVTGAMEVWAAIRLRREFTNEWILAVVGVLSVIAGILILVRPDVGAIAIAQVIGIYALVAGVLMLISAWRLRRATTETTDFRRTAQAS